jgi:DNA-binding transcriptional MerR regulator
MDFDTTQLLGMFKHLSRDMIYAFEKQRVIKPRHVSKGTLRGRRYQEADVRILSIIDRLYAMGFSPERARDLAVNPSALKHGRTTAAVRDTTELMKVLIDGEPGAWDRFSSIAASLADAQRCFVFVVDHVDNVSVLELKGAFPNSELEASTTPDVPSRWRRHFENGGGAINLFGKELTEEGYLSDLGDVRTCTSVLAIPIRGRKAGPKGLLGVEVFENRLSPNGTVNDGSYFDPESEQICATLASAAALLATWLPRLAAPEALVQASRTATSLKVFLSEVLKRAIPMVAAYRGDAVWRNEITDRTQIVQQFGASEVKLGLGAELPHRSITHRVMETGVPRIVSDVSKDGDYFPTNHDTSSELAIPLKLPGRPKPNGAINVESRDLDWFDDDDRACLQALGEYASIFARIVEGNQILPLPVAEDVALETQVYTLRLKGVLQEIEHKLGLDRGVTFLADRIGGVLRCAALNGFDESNPAYRDFTFPFEEVALATKAFHDKEAYFSTNPKTDLYASPRAIEFFLPESPVIAMPLLFRETAIGVMVLWSSESARTTKKQIRSLEPYAHMAVTTMAVATSERQLTLDIQRHTHTLNAIRKLMSEIRSQVSYHGSVRATLRALTQADFDRARVFDYDAKRRTFTCIDSMGVEADGAFTGKEINIAHSPYALKTEKTLPEYSEAELRDPTDPGLYGPDPNAEMFTKPPELPWAVQPLFSGRKLFGYIAADNKTSRRPISSWELGSLSLFGTLAAQALANAISHSLYIEGYLRPRGLPKS